MPSQKPSLVRLAASLLVACALLLGSVPATASAPSNAPSSAVPATAAVRTERSLVFEGDFIRPNPAARGRRAAFAWTGRTIRYKETIPAKWDWSLSTAIAKWNAAGGGIRFVKAAKPRRARLTISARNIGSAAGMATMGRRRHAWVRLSSTYNSVSAEDPRNQVQVMGIFAHELGHVLGFQHTSAKCSLMSTVLDVDGCGILSAAKPGYYKCRTIDTALVVAFVRAYGGVARHPGSWCRIDPLFS